MSSRDYIMGRIRWSLGRGSFENEPTERLQSRISEPTSNLIPKRGQGDAKSQRSTFVKMAKEVNATVSRLKSMQSIPRAVQKYLKDQGLEQKIRIAPHENLESLDWKGLDASFGATNGDDLNGLVIAYAGVAETGSLALLSGPQSPTTLNFLPDNHIIVLNTSDLVGDYETVYQRMRSDSNSNNFMPRAMNWVSGPSRTADIEQTLLLGAHGPRKLHILLVENDGEKGQI